MVVPDGGGSPPPPLAIDVDPNKVTGFAATVQTNVQGTITPTAPGVRSALDTGVPFGQGNPSVPLRAMLAQYQQCLNDMTVQLKNVGDFVEVLVGAADQISANYRTSDRLAAASNADIVAILNTAITDMLARNTPATAGGGPGRARAQ
jgi:hypothetical protein